MNTLLQESGRLLQRARLLKNWTQADLAAQLGVSVRAIKRMEAGDNVRVSTFIQALNALGYLSDFLHLLSQDRPSTIEQYQLIADGSLDQRQRAR